MPPARVSVRSLKSSDRPWRSFELHSTSFGREGLGASGDSVGDAIQLPPPPGYEPRERPFTVMVEVGEVVVRRIIIIFISYRPTMTPFRAGSPRAILYTWLLASGSQIHGLLASLFSSSPKR